MPPRRGHWPCPRVWRGKKASCSGHTLPATETRKCPGLGPGGPKAAREEVAEPPQLRSPPAAPGLRGASSKTCDHSSEQEATSLPPPQSWETRVARARRARPRAHLKSRRPRAPQGAPAGGGRGRGKLSWSGPPVGPGHRCSALLSRERCPVLTLPPRVSVTCVWEVLGRRQPAADTVRSTRAAKRAGVTYAAT